MNINGFISIKKAIVHVLDQKTKHTMSDYDIDLNDRLNALITKHVTKSNISEAKVFAKFKDESSENNKVKESCLKIFDNDEVFIEESKNISRELYKAMSGTNASAANLLVVYFTYDSKKALAIMKLDFSDNFYTQEKTIEDKVKIEVKINGTGFSDSQKLRKCAIIDEDTIKGGKEFLLLDTQSGDVSDYFRIGFLNSNLINDAKINTKKVIKEVNNYINEKFEANPKEMVKKTFLFTNIIETSNEFKIDTVLAAVFQTESDVIEVKNIISNANIDFNFKIDKGVLEKKLKNVTIVSENGISLKAKPSLFNEKDIILSDPDSDGKVDITIKGIKIDKNQIG